MYSSLLGLLNEVYGAERREKKFLKIAMVALVAIATIGIGMANTNRVLADDSGGFQNHFGDNHEGDEHSETCISLSCCHHCGSADDDN